MTFGVVIHTPYELRWDVRCNRCRAHYTERDPSGEQAPPHCCGACGSRDIYVEEQET